MKWLGRLAAAGGLAAAAAVFLAHRPREVWHLLAAGGVLLLLSAAAHLVPMLLNAQLWRQLIEPARRPSLGVMLRAVWIRESVNGLLPVARVGGEVASFRVLRRAGLEVSAAAASLVADLQVGILAQFVFTLAAIGWLLLRRDPAASQIAFRLGYGALALAPLAAGFLIVPRIQPVSWVGRRLSEATRGRLADFAASTAGIDAAVLRTWTRTRDVAVCLGLWQPLQCAATAAELWLALRAMHLSAGFLQIVVLQVLIESLSSAAFFVPGALGVQEGGFVLIGGVLGLDPATSLALAGARRARDLLVYFPGLFAWQLSEHQAGESENPPSEAPEAAVAARTAPEVSARSSSV